jgi:hypothetical protein
MRQWWICVCDEQSNDLQVSSGFGCYLAWQVLHMSTYHLRKLYAKTARKKQMCTHLVVQFKAVVQQYAENQKLLGCS